ncbi:EAL domain-containing protein [Sulfobacillus thermosulfidooxidans]|uniref:EAL domain-containing protein n=1 Tax=Sulfobacillus thermosulfidooxidans TaxID=28034 RepID=UPI00041AFD75|nr:EAL domain-containing protein [Sulfobacillus thermosulfidooxidans]
MNQTANRYRDNLWPEWYRSKILHAAFQPIVSLRDGSVLAYEGLSRPQMPDGDPVSVLDLMASAEGHDGLLMFDQLAFQQILDAFCHSGCPDTWILFINILPKSLLSPLPFLRALQHCDQIKPQQIVLEISERETISEGDHKLHDYLAPFREMGIRIALDDLGSGYSGLTRLIELQPDFAKIDLSLVRDVDKNPIKFALLESTARFAKKTAATSLIAEGIETFAELYTLQEIGVEYGQGYLLGKPEMTFHTTLTAADFTKTPLPRPSATYQLDTLLSTTRRMVQGLAHGEGRYAYLLSLAKKLTGADVVALFKVEGNDLRYLESTERLSPQDEAFFTHTVIPQSSALYHSILTREPTIFQQPTNGPRIWSDRFHIHSAIAVPICDNLGCWGLLHLGYHEPNQIRSDLIHMAQGIAALIVLAVGYTQKEEAFSDQGMLGEPLFEAISALADSADLEHLLAKAISAALAVTGGHEGWIGILQKTVLHCVLPDGQAFDVSRDDLFDPSTDDGQGPVGQILQTRTPRIIPNIMNDPTLNPWLEQMRAQGIQSAAGIPLISGDQLLGILKVYHSQMGGFTPGRIRRLYALSSLATALIERSLNSLAAEERARRQTLLAQCLAQINYLKTRDEILNLLVSTLEQYGPFPLVVVVKPQGGVYIPVATSPAGNGNLLAAGFMLPRHDRHAVTEALQQERSVFINAEESRSDALSQFAKRQGFLSYAVIGVGIPDMAVILFSRDHNGIDIQLPELESYIHSLGTALSKILLQEHIAQEQQQMDAMLDVIKTLPMVASDDILWQEVANTLTNLVGADGGWLIEGDDAQCPRMAFGQVPKHYYFVPQPLRHDQFRVTLAEADIPLALKEWGIKHLVGFRLSFPSLQQHLFLVVSSAKSEGFTRSQSHRMEMLISFAASIYEILEMRRQQQHAAHTDHVTQLPNDLGIEEYYRQLQEMPVHPGAGCILLDIVGLSHINQAYGEQAGDHRLTELAQYLSAAMNYDGVVGRLGSDEFILLHPDIDATTLKKETKRLVKNAPLPLRWVSLYIPEPRRISLQHLIRTAYQILHSQGSGHLEIMPES